MNVKYLAVAVLCLSGCKTTENLTSSPNLALGQMHVDCRYGSMMTADLERIIANPQYEYPVWRRAFSDLAGHATPDQRVASAKAVLWTIRTQCKGF
jgi:hypothetical protein